MPYKEKPIIKQYRTIGAVAEKYDIPTSKIRYYIDEYFKDWFDVERDKKGRRQFKHRDVKLIEAIRYLIVEKGKTLEGVKMSLGPRIYLFDKYL